MKINTLSLFDGLSGAKLALEKVEGLEVGKYYTSEIDRYAIEVSNRNYPNNIQLGNVLDIDFSSLTDIDLIVGGFPCTNLSKANNKLPIGIKFDNYHEYMELKNKGVIHELVSDRKNNVDSILFWEVIRCLHELPNYSYWLFENVNMSKDSLDVINKYLMLKPYKINSNLFSAQNRTRLYWTNIPVADLPKNISPLSLKDILDEEYTGKYVEDTKRNLRHERALTEKALTCTATMYKGAGNNGMTLVRDVNTGKLRCLTVNEVKRLQGIREDFDMSSVSKTQAYKMLGNSFQAWTVAHIMQGLVNNEAVN